MTGGADASDDETASSSSQVSRSLGPHVVGQRVVVRRVLRGRSGPSGGPAMTDVLGICVRWSDGECVVQPESGPAVVIATPDIVSGKPVPSRPSPRLRVSPATAQQYAAAMFWDLHTEPVGAWTLRASSTHSARRANSVLAFEPPGTSDAIERVRAFYAPGRAIAAVLCESEEESAFRAAGWVDEDPAGTPEPTSFRIASVATVRRALRGADPDLGAGLETLAPAVVETSLVDTGRVVARGIAGYADDWVGIRSVHVDPEHRGRGLARAVMAELLGWASERGAATVCLQVLEDNVAAVGLYDSLGFTEHHRLRYLATSPAS